MPYVFALLRGWMSAGLLLMALAGAVYLRTLLPGVGYHGDTANLQFVGYVLGTTHPTGYPLYTLLNAAFVRLLPFGTLAFRANLLSAVCGVLAVWVLYRLCRALTDDGLAAFAAAGVFAFTPVFWGQCLVAEVYSLHALFMAGVLFLATRWAQTRQPAFLLWGGALYALSFAHHLTALMLLPALGVLVAATDWRAPMRPRAILVLLAAAVLAALLYGYLFWRTADPATPYLETAVPSLERLGWVLRGAHFQNRMFAFSGRQLLTERLPLFARMAAAQYGAVTPLVLLGMIVFRGWRLGLCLGLYLAVNTLWALTYDIPDIAVYVIPSVLVSAVFLAAGLAWLRRRWPRPAVRPAWALAALLPLWPLARNAAAVSQRGNVETERQVRAALDGAGRDAVLVSPDYDYSEYFWYLLIGEGQGRARNVSLVHHFNADHLRAYLRNDAPLYLPTERRWAPPKLRAFFFLPAAGQARHLGKYRLGQLQAAGLTVEPVTERLFWVRPAADDAGAAAAP